MPDDRWSLDFVSDQLACGRRFRILAIFDDCTRDGVYTLNLDNSGLTRLTFGATTSDGLPSWSTDGSQIVFQSRRDGNVQLYVMNADGTEQTRLMVSNRADEFPRWSR